MIFMIFLLYYSYYRSQSATMTLHLISPVMV
uniref:Uncharacterized protein n=1 Tax=Anguilla anguilla TaxID=7936 RepID=A0A0E9TAU1_ANGAN